MKKYKNKNKGFYWILTCVEILSRFAFAIPVYRKDTKHMTKALEKVLHEFYSHFHRYPQTVQFDNGLEFYNVGIKILLKGYNVEYFSTQSDRKAAIVERFNRTLKTCMWNVFYKRGSYKWLNILGDLVDSYNNTKHSTIGMKPNQVDKSNDYKIWTHLYGERLQETVPTPRYKVGDSVTISKYKSVFARGYEPNLTSEIFDIKGISYGNPIMYFLKDKDDEEILGKFYEQELSHVV